MKDYRKWAEQVRAAQKKLAERAEKARAKLKENARLKERVDG